MWGTERYGGSWDMLSGMTQTVDLLLIRLCGATHQSLLGLVRSQVALTLGNNIWVFLLLIRAEQINLIIVLWGILGVLGHSDGLGTVGADGLGCVTGKGSELVDVGGDVAVPSVGCCVPLEDRSCSEGGDHTVGVLLDGRLLGDTLEADNIGLGRGIASSC